MSWHGVPYRTLLQLGNTHLQLAGTNTSHTIDDQLMNHAVVALLQATSLDVVGILQSHLLGRISLMSAGTVHIELSWLGCILAAYLDVLGATTHIESLLEIKGIFLAIHVNSTLATDVDDTQLTVVKQVLLIVWLVCIERCNRSQLQRSGCWLCTTDEETVKHGVGPVYLTRSEHLLDSELAAEAICCVMLGIHWVASITNVVVGVGILSLHLVSTLTTLAKSLTCC